MNSKKLLLGVALIGLVGAVTFRTADSADKQSAKADEATVRTRKTVRMLDDIYKGSIVTITQHYVNDENTIPAGTAFKQLFKSVEEKGWHKVRLVDATGEPYSDENVAETEFEKAAIKKLVAGETWIEKEMKNKDGKRILQVATPIPVVFEKCVMCHDNYADVPKGKAIGALTYEVPIE